VEACIPSQATWCGLYVGHTDIVTVFSPLSPLIILPPILHTHIFFLCRQPAPNLALETFLKEEFYIAI